MRLSYDVVIATRNRPEALSLSIPSILRDQLRLPQQLIVVDSSEDQYPINEIILKIERKYNFTILYLKSPIANLCFQRNLGLEKVTSDIIVFPDDDSIFYPGAIDEIMRIYENDNDPEPLIAGVCAAEATQPPPNFCIANTYSQSKYDRIKNNIGKFRYKIEHLFFPDPFQSFGKMLINSSCKIEWLAKENSVKVEYMTGFRMSFRTNIFNYIKFDEIFDSYCLFEDIDVCFSAAKYGALVGARNAKIYHHKFPAQRSGGLNLGFWQIFNRGYIIAKHAQSNKRLRNHLLFFTFYKLFLYLLNINSQFGRQRLQGALLAAKNINKLLEAKSKEDLTKLYREVNEILKE